MPLQVSATKVRDGEEVELVAYRRNAPGYLSLPLMERALIVAWAMGQDCGPGLWPGRCRVKRADGNANDLELLVGFAHRDDAAVHTVATHFYR